MAHIKLNNVGPSHQNRLWWVVTVPWAGCLLDAGPTEASRKVKLHFNVCCQLLSPTTSQVAKIKVKPFTLI